MSLRLWVATRKGLFPIDRSPAGWTVGSPSFLGDPVSIVFDDGRDGSVYAALNLGHFGVKLHRSADRGATWTECGVPSFAAHEEAGSAAAEPGGGPSPAPGEAAPGETAPEEAKRPALKLLWALEADSAQDGALWAGTIPGALFRSADRGATWQLNRPLWDRPERANWFGGGYDEPGIHSIAVDPRDAAHVTVGVSCGGVWESRDGGTSWRTRARGMRAAYMPPERSEEPDIQDPHRLVACPSAPDHLWVQHHNGVFRSMDGGDRWEEVTTARPSGFGFAVAVHPHDGNTAWFVPAVRDERRVPVDGRLVVSRTRDGGRTFDVIDRGLPSPSYDLVYRHGLDVDATGDVLAFGSTTGGLWVSEDAGDSWLAVSVHLPPIYAVRFAAA